MNTILKGYFVIVWLVFLGEIQAAEQPSVLNLQGFKVSNVRVAGVTVLLVITGQPPHFLTWTNFAPSPVTHREDLEKNRVQVSYGADMLGFAQVRVLTSPRAKATNNVVRLDFDTREQARAAGAALRADVAVPTPLTSPQGRQ
jgi:hypothetical protein